MSIEESDPLDGYGIWSGPSVEQHNIFKSIYADYDPNDPHGEYDEDKPFELMHHLRDTLDQSRRISRFASLEDAIAAGQVLSLLLPEEYDKENDWYNSPMLEVWERSGSRWNKKYSCQDKFGSVAALLDGLKRTNAQLRKIEAELERYQK